MSSTARFTGANKQTEDIKLGSCRVDAIAQAAAEYRAKRMQSAQLQPNIQAGARTPGGSEADGRM